VEPGVRLLSDFAEMISAHMKYEIRTAYGFSAIQDNLDRSTPEDFPGWYPVTWYQSYIDVRWHIGQLSILFRAWPSTSSKSQYVVHLELAGQEERRVKFVVS